jgi:hypothetical protein
MKSACRGRRRHLLVCARGPIGGRGIGKIEKPAAERIGAAATFAAPLWIKIGSEQGNLKERLPSMIAVGAQVSMSAFEK